MTHLLVSPNVAASPRRGVPAPLAQGLRRTARWTVLLLAAVSAVHAASVAPVAAENGMVVTAQHLATRIGVDVLKDGGNAVDAAVAVGYALAVVYPAAGNLGGGGFMTIQLADGRKTFFDFREKAPLAATANMYIGPDGNVVPGLSTKGHLAVAVPGTVHGLELALKQYGTMKRAALMAPAIRYAEQGFELEQGDVEGDRVDDRRRDARGCEGVQRSAAKELADLDVDEGGRRTALHAAQGSSGCVGSNGARDRVREVQLPVRGDRLGLLLPGVRPQLRGSHVR